METVTETTISTDLTPNVALIVGVTGLVGKELAKALTSRPQWTVYGLARTPGHYTVPFHNNKNYHFIPCNLLDFTETAEKLSSVPHVTHIFWVTWATQFPLDTQECYEQNQAAFSNTLNAVLRNAKSVKHVSLQTGTKYYVSLNDMSGQTTHIYDEESPRVSGSYNFYYAVEDVVRERLQGTVPWSVHRPGLILGCSRRTVFNFMGCICVYGAICRYLNHPFVFGGERMCWEEPYIDASDARLVAEQQIWACVEEEVNGQAFNSINGLGFTWKEIWPALAEKFRVDVPAEMFVPGFTFSESMGGMGSVWDEIVVKEGLCRTKMEDLANWWFLDALFRLPVKMLACRKKVDRLGFGRRYKVVESMVYWIDSMRDEKLVP